MASSPDTPGPDTFEAPPPPAGHGRKFVLRSLATYGTSGTTSALQLVNVLIVSRTLGATGRGEVAFLATVAYLSAQFASLGIQQANSNIGGAEPQSRRSLATNSLLFSLALGLAAIAVVVALTAIVPAAGAHSRLSARAIALASIPAIIFGDYLSSLLTANYRFAVVNASAVVAPTVSVALNGALALGGELTVTRAVIAWVLGQVLGTAVVAVATAGGDGFGRPTRSLARRMAVFGLKTHAGRVLNFGNYRLDQWLVGSIAGARQLGLYSVAVAWSEGLFLLPNAIAGVQRPDLVRSTPDVARRRGRRAHNIVQGVTAILAIALIALARPLCVGVFGPQFAGSVNQLRILALGAFGIVTLKQLGDALIAQRRPLLESAAVALAFVSTIVLDATLIPGHGGLGAAIASSVAYTIGGIAALVLFLRAIDVSGRRTAARAADS
jgi:O-antigen/teichoic acid export membrane protein